MSDNKSKPTKKQKAALNFFGNIPYRDVRRLRSLLLAIHIIFDIVLLLIIGALLAVNAFNQVRPLPVIVTNSKTGHVTFVQDTTAPAFTTDITVTEFMRTYIQKRSAQDPDIAQNQAYVYSHMQTPRLTEILTAERTDAGKHQKYFDKNVKADFEIDQIKINGDKKIGGELTVIGTGKMVFRPAVGFDGDNKNIHVIPCFFQSTVKVYEQRKKIPWGLLLDYYRIDFFEDNDLLRAFLLKANIDLSSEGDVNVQR